MQGLWMELPSYLCTKPWQIIEKEQLSALHVEFLAALAALIHIRITN